jgi:hypothetical protein
MTTVIGGIEVISMQPPQNMNVLRDEKSDVQAGGSMISLEAKLEDPTWTSDPAPCGQIQEAPGWWLTIGWSTTQSSVKDISSYLEVRAVKPKLPNMKCFLDFCV